eukprot:CAMPEP_0176453850 /NCGR_PEP_ID=MMETSP0127-20121128/29511_1 /TAXON_ID=938130 /ORGANISM="Platyophrya macrostoma, Strain WH" /LENGTH=66 /DNA_ID=CAMNT_0017842843 /DNA_START=59 /DNA_END=259 /DNA_ORIENTATION=-
MANDQTMRIRSQLHDQNIDKRGKVPKSRVKKEEKFAVGPVLLGVFLFVVVGSALFQMLNAATQGDI